VIAAITRISLPHPSQTEMSIWKTPSEHFGPGLVFQEIIVGAAFFIDDAIFVDWFQDDHFAVFGVRCENAVRKRCSI
jgi:hypothetical protein